MSASKVYKQHKHPYQQCKRCIMDTTDPEINFDERGYCNHCRYYDWYKDNQQLTGEAAKLKLEQLVETMKKEGKGKDYDCIMGLSGGVDSSYLAYFAVKELGLRPLVVHVDAGWNSELAVNNIENTINSLNLDLHTLVIEWEDIKNLQRAFFRAGLANLDVPQDHSFIAGIYAEAKKYGIKYTLNGGNMATESILPNAWGYDAADAWHLKSVYSQFGEEKLRSYPTVGYFYRRFYLPYISKSQTIRPLEYIPYVKDDVKEVLKTELKWRDYGGKHYESRYTKFFQAHYLPEKFGFDKRLAHQSSLIVSGQTTREAALAEVALPLYDANELEDDRDYFIKKLELSREEYDTVMAKEPVTYESFKHQKSADDILRKINELVKGKRRY